MGPCGWFAGDRFGHKLAKWIATIFEPIGIDLTGKIVAGMLVDGRKKTKFAFANQL